MCLNGIIFVGKLEYFSGCRGMTMEGTLLLHTSFMKYIYIYILKARLTYRASGSAKPILLQNQDVNRNV